MSKAPANDELVKAFRHAVDGEHRFGARVDVREELDARWAKVIELIQCLKKNK